MPKIDEYPHPMVLDILAGAAGDVLSNKRMLRTRPTEVAFSFELGWRLKTAFQDWDVSGEYDRCDTTAKTLDYVGKPPARTTNRIRPDLLVHIMGERNNLLVVELKLSHNTSDWDYDRWKLCGLTYPDGNYGYSLGVHLVMDVTKGIVSDAAVFTQAALSEDLTAIFREMVGLS